MVSDKGDWKDDDGFFDEEEPEPIPWGKLD